MYYTTSQVQNSSADFENCLVIPSLLTDYVNCGTSVETTRSGKQAFCFHGDLLLDEAAYFCPECHCQMHIHDRYPTRLRHLCFGDKVSFVMLDKYRFICPECGKTVMQTIPFKAEHHRITRELERYTEDLLQAGYTNKQVSQLTGLGQHTVKSIDKARLERLYTEVKADGESTKRVLKKPEEQARYLAIDEFKLHDGYKYATHIINLENGHILWIQEGKKKQVVYDFIEHVGLDWMDNVEAVACDMNSDFQEAFEEKCPHIQPVFDHFHIIKNFNDKVIGQVRKDEQKRLAAEGDWEGYRALKRSRYILTSTRETLEKKDKLASEVGKPEQKDSLFPIHSVAPKGGNQEKYERLIASNRLLFTADLVKEMLVDAYKTDSEIKMADKISAIIDTCNATNNKHFMWFARLLDSHFEGIIAHASIPLSSGKMEGINNKIKTLRRQAYGYPDDEYFFLKLLDLSRRSYVRNPSSHKLFH